MLTPDEFNTMLEQADSFRSIPGLINKLLGQLEIYQQALVTIRDGDSVGAALVAKLALETRWIKLSYTSPMGKVLYRCVKCGRITYYPETNCKKGCKNGLL